MAWLGRLLRRGGGVSSDGFRSRRGATAWLAIFAVALMGAIVIGTAIAVHKFKESAVESASQALDSAALLLARHFDQQFGEFAVLQKQLIAELESHGIASPEVFRSEMATLAVHEVLRARATGGADVAGASVFDFEGALINSSQRWPVPDIRIADRAYFQRLRRDGGLLVAIEIVRGRFSSSPAIVFARRISGPHGEFLGVVSRAIAPGALESFMASAGLGRDASIAIHHRDGALLARYPHLDDFVGRNLKGGPAVQKAIFEKPNVVAELVSPVDGRDRLVASRMLTDYPLVVIATRTTESALAAWRTQTKFFIGVAGASILIIALTLSLIFRRINRQVADEKTWLDRAVNNISQGLLMFDSSERLIVCNDKYIEMYALSTDVVRPGCSFRDLIRHRKASGSFAGDVERYCDVVLRNKNTSTTSLVETSDGRLIQIRDEPVPGGAWVATHEDVTEQRRAQEQIAHLAHHDPLTDLPNRILFRGQVDRRFAELAADTRFAILYIDVDEFKAINDSLGHHAGDEFLKSVASRLKTCVGPTDMVARLGGDEFAVVRSDVSDVSEVAALAEAINAAIRNSADCLGQGISSNASIGIAIAPDHGSAPDELLKNADLAMYAAKADGRGTHRFFVAEMDARVKERRMLELDLRRSLGEDGFEIHYQPLVDLATDAVAGCEALLRWRHPARGTISPADFIPLAEETGLINELGEWVLRRACAEAASWPDGIALAVNVSPVQFKSRTLAMKVAAALASSGLAANRLELEITEAVLIRDDEEALAILHQLRELGVRIALDDFGTGYSSLSYLRRFPFDKIKIDRSFIGDIAEASGSSPIVQAVVNMAAARSMTTTAEGVENEMQREILRRLGCCQMQGYLFSPALPAEGIRKLLTGEASHAAA